MRTKKLKDDFLLTLKAKVPFHEDHFSSKTPEKI